MKLERKHFPIIRIIIAIILAAVVIYFGLKWEAKSKDLPDITIASSRVDDVTFKVDGRDVDFLDKIATHDSQGDIDARFFGEPVGADINDDGIKDAVVWFSYSAGGSGTFYYVAGAIKTEDGYVGTNAILLGDRIAPQTLEVQNGVIIANYAERKEGEPMTADPSIGISKYLRVDGDVLVETVPPVQVVSPGDGCLSIGGRFDPKNMECLSVSPEQCVSIGGIFNQCASACRNDPKATMCTLQCVGVCQFNKAKAK